MENKSTMYLIVASLAVILAWLIRNRMNTGQASPSVGSLLVNINGQPTESGFTVDNNTISPSTMWTSDKIVNYFGTVINDNMYGNQTTFSSNKLKKEFDALNRKISTLLDDTSTSQTSTWSSQKIMGMINPRVYFDVVMNDSMKITGTIVYTAFSTQSQNSGMDIASGTFTCPQAGLYRFTFTGMRYYFVTSPTEARVRMLLNNNVIATTASTSNVVAPDDNPRPSGGESLNINVLVNLSVGDKIFCRIDSGGIFDNASEHLTHFTGELLQPAILQQDIRQ